MRLRGAVDRVLGGAVAALLGAAVLNVAWQVVARFAVGSGGSFTDELARYLLIWVGMLGAAYAAGQRLHLAVDLLPGRPDGRPRRILALAVEAAVFSFAAAVLVFGGARLVALTLLLEQRSAALRVPLGAVYAVLPLSGLLVMFYAFDAAAERLRAARRRGPRV